MVKLVFFLLLSVNLYSSEIAIDEDSGFVFPYWRSMTLLNKYPLYSEDHRAYVDIYVDDLAKEPYILEEDDFPVGSIIIKPLYPKQKREDASRLMIMMKMKKGYDSKNSDWWYGVYDGTGTTAHNKGKIESCIICHAEAEDTDYLFSESVMFRILSQPVLKNQNSLHNPLKSP